MCWKFWLSVVFVAMVASSACSQNSSLLEAEIDIISLIDQGGKYAIAKQNRDTAFQITLADTGRIDSLLSAYGRQLADIDDQIDGHPLYSLLLEPLQPLRKHLMIKRSGAFAKLPVETLMERTPLGHESHKQHPYLIKKHSVTYLTSMDTWQKAVDNPVQGDGTVLLVNDRLEKDAYLKEVKDIRDDFGGNLQYFVDQDPAVKSLVEKARLVHFAAPVTAEDGGIWAAGRTYRTDAELVSLSSFDGNAEQLADQMIDAGAKALLFGPPLSDTTARRRIVTRYYRQLFDGDRKCDALQVAISKYVSDANTSEIAHPSYWAGWEQYGDIKSIDGNVPTKLYWILIIVMIALFILLRKAGGRLY